MKNIFTYNAYNILGLDSSSTQKEIIRRSKEIINRLKIDDYPEYETDLSFIKPCRTEDSTKIAAQDLQMPKKRIKEFFFWYQYINETDKGAFTQLKIGNYQEAISIWDEASKVSTALSLLHKKNLAILYCTSLYNESNVDFLRKSISLWNEILHSEKFWAIFIKTYELTDELRNGEGLITEFKHSVQEVVSNIYIALHKQYNDPIYINEFQKFFSQKSLKMEKDILAPIYELINNNIEILEKLVLSKDNALDKGEMKKISPLIQSIQSDFTKLKNLGLYADSQTKILRDKCVEAIRQLTIELYNNLSESDIAENLLKTALTIVGTTALEEKIKQEIQLIQKERSNLAILQPVLNLIKKQKYDTALNQIELGIRNHADDQELYNIYLDVKKECISLLAIKTWNSAHKIFEEDAISAAPLFTEAGRLVYDNIELFNFNKEGIDNVIAEIKEAMSKINTDNLIQVDDYRNTFVKFATEKFEGKHEETIFIILIDRYILGGIATVIKSAKKNATLDKLFSWVVQIIIAIVIIAIVNFFR